MFFPSHSLSGPLTVAMLSINFPRHQMINSLVFFGREEEGMGGGGGGGGGLGWSYLALPVS